MHDTEFVALASAVNELVSDASAELEVESVVAEDVRVFIMLKVSVLTVDG